MALGQTPIDQVVLPTKSRDELPAVLAGLQWIYKTPELNEAIFELLEERIVGDKKDTGRPGMDLWHILVLGVVRLARDCDYDSLEHTANFDSLVRQIMGVATGWGAENEASFHHKTLSENVCHIDPEMLEQINVLVAQHGQPLLGQKKNETQRLRVKTDSYVLETNVHYPTDCNLLWDAARKSIELSARLCEVLGMEGWRKSRHWKKRVKGALRRCDKAAYRGGAGKSEALEKATVTYLDVARQVEGKTAESIGRIGRQALSACRMIELSQLIYFHEMLQKHIDLVERRLLKKEVIAHEEKVFSLFEPHTELIKKGKMMPPVELGHRLLVSSEQHGLIIDYKIMEAGAGEPGELEPLVDRLESGFGQGAIESLSMDQGFSNMALRQRLEERIGLVIMPKKGRRSAASRERENAPEWIAMKNRHAAVESDINALEQCGLNRCPDKGLRGYERYAGLGVLAYNLHKIGKALLAAKTPQPAKRAPAVRRRAA